MMKLQQIVIKTNNGDATVVSVYEKWIYEC